MKRTRIRAKLRGRNSFSFLPVDKIVTLKSMLGEEIEKAGLKSVVTR
jgi:hypothetical protein